MDDGAYVVPAEFMVRAEAIIVEELARVDHELEFSKSEAWCPRGRPAAALPAVCKWREHGLLIAGVPVASK